MANYATGNGGSARSADDSWESSGIAADDTVDALLPIARSGQYDAGVSPLGRLTPGGEPARAASTPLPRVGRFHLVRKTSVGAFREVYMARDHRLDRTVAVKLHWAQDQGAFRREAKLLAQLRHPGIVTVHEFGMTATGASYLVCDWVQGSTLQRLMNERSLTCSEAIRIIAVCAEALDYAHQRGIIHRDIKPANILISSTKQPQIADFGLALAADTENATSGALCGTPAYMAPEQIVGPPQPLDGRCDIWALGVILYQLVAGHRPFVGHGPAELFRMVTEEAPEPLDFQQSQFPTALGPIIDRCLAKQAIERYATAGELARELHACLESLEPLRSDRQGEAPVAHETGRSDMTHRWPTAMGAIAVCLLIIACSWAAASWRAEVQFAGLSTASDLPARLAPVTSSAAAAMARGSELAGPSFRVRIRNPRLPHRHDLKPTDVEFPLLSDDQLLIDLQTDEPTYVWAFWVDDRSQITALYPTEEAVSTPRRSYQLRVPASRIPGRCVTGTVYVLAHPSLRQIRRKFERHIALIQQNKEPADGQPSHVQADGVWALDDLLARLRSQHGIVRAIRLSKSS